MEPGPFSGENRAQQLHAAVPISLRPHDDGNEKEEEDDDDDDDDEDSNHKVF